MLAAGFGERLGSTAAAPPKILLRFDGKTLLQRHAEILQFLGFDELVVGVGNKAEQVKREIRSLPFGDVIRAVDCPQFAMGAPNTLWGCGLYGWRCALRSPPHGPALSGTARNLLCDGSHYQTE